MYLCQAPGGIVVRRSGCAHHFSPKLRQPRHHFSVGMKGCCQQHLSPNGLLSKTTKMVLQKIALFLTIDLLRIHVTLQMEQMSSSLQKISGNGRDMRGTWRVGGEINAPVQQLRVCKFKPKVHRERRVPSLNWNMGLCGEESGI